MKGAVAMFDREFTYRGRDGAYGSPGLTSLGAPGGLPGAAGWPGRPARRRRAYPPLAAAALQPRQIPDLGEGESFEFEGVWRWLSPGAIVERVQQLLGTGAFALSLLGRFASGQIWNEDHLALEVLFQRQPRLRPAALATAAGQQRLRLLRQLAVKHQRELTPIRERVVRPIFGNPATFQIGPVGTCQLRDLRADVR